MESIRLMEIYSPEGGVVSMDDHLRLKRFRLEACILALCCYINSVHCSRLPPVGRQYDSYLLLCSPRCGSITAFEITLYPAAQHLWTVMYRSLYFLEH